MSLDKVQLKWETKYFQNAEKLRRRKIDSFKFIVLCHAVGLEMGFIALKAGD